MRFFILSLVFILGCCASCGNSIQGTYGKSRVPEFGYLGRCGQITLFKDSTFEHITCAEIIYPYQNSCRRNGDTIYFKGNALGLPSGHSKYLVKRGKLYKIQYGNIVDDRWIYKRYSRIVRPLK